MKKNKVLVYIFILWVLTVIYAAVTNTASFFVPLVIWFFLLVMWDFLSNAWSILTNRYYWEIQNAKTYAEAKGYEHFVKPIDLRFFVISKDGQSWHVLYQYQQDYYPQVIEELQTRNIEGLQEWNGSHYIISKTTYAGLEKVLEEVEKIKDSLRLND